ncbi:hypothetical protein NXS19_007936 [Fusarium pseudograminearum]|nr:hypothetical protein NXS19_007936 [Fusarium pseudograminearum]
MVDCEIYTIGWICATRPELVAAQELLDEELEDIVPTPEHDNNSYTLGKIGEHHVVIAVLPRGQCGGTSAANAARDMVRTFTNVRIGFMVGIGGGIPTQYDIRLGDIVVGSPTYRSGGLVQYDLGTAIQGQDIKLMGALNQPPLSVLTAISALSAHHVRRGHNLNQTVENVVSNNPNLVDEGFQRPHDDTDKLYESNFIHPRAGSKCSDVCPDSNIKPRNPRTKGQGQPKIHYGLIASGSQLMEDAIARDKIAEKEYVLCFEMEGAGLANHFPCVVIRGICDYSDSHRGRDWQGYAALVAAAYAKQLLLRIPPQKIKEERKMKDILQDIEERLEPIAETKEIVKDLNVKRQREEELKLLDWLKATDYSTEQHGYLEPQQRQPGTGQQFINSEDFQTWLKTKNSLLLCCGMPGAGKTITTAITIEYIYSKFKDDPAVGVAYVYCNYQKRDQQTPQDLLTSLLKQLALSQSPFPEAIHELHEKNNNGRERPSFEDIMNTLCKVVNAFSTTFIMIDALDEHNSWDTFLSHIIVLQKQTTANIFLTSRPKPTLPQKLRGCLIHDIQADEQDVGLYIDQRMTQMMVVSENNTDHSEGVKAHFRELIRKKLSNAVNGIFLLARIYLDNLKQETNLKGISNFLENLPTGLRAYTDAYEKTIQRIRNQGQKHRDLAKRALVWLTFAQEPLSKEAFRYALSVEDGMSHLHDEDLQSTSVILHVCMDLVKIEDGSNTVSLLHFTTMEYLKANPNCLLSLESPDEPKFINNPSDSQIQRSLAKEYYEMKLATTCATYLSFNDFISGYRDSDSQQEFIHKYPLYSYAMMNWAHHARQGEPSSKILDFLNSETYARELSKGLSILSSHFGVRLGRYSFPKGHVTGLHLTALFGLHRETASLLNSGMKPDVRDENGRTPLSYASEFGHVDVVDQLLDCHVDPESKSIWKNPNIPRTALSHAAEMGYADIVTLLLEKGKANPDSKPSPFVEGQFERTPLSFASRARHLSVVNILLEAQG